MAVVPVFEFADGYFRGFVPSEKSAALRRRHVFATWVFGVRDHPGASQEEAFGPGNPLAVVPQRENEWNDPSALAVWDEERRFLIGYIPPYISAPLAASDHSHVALSLYERRRDDQRIGLGILISRQILQLEIVAPPDNPRILFNQLPMERFAE